MHTRKSIVSLIAAGGLLLALPGTAGAPKVFGLPDATGGCSETNVGEGSYVGGALTVTRFDVKEDTLVAAVQLTATCRIDEVFRSQTEATGSVAAQLLENDDEHLLFTLTGSVGARDTTFAIESDLEVAAEKSARSIVKKVNRDPDMAIESLAAALNRYLGKQK